MTLIPYPPIFLSPVPPCKLKNSLLFHSSASCSLKGQRFYTSFRCVPFSATSSQFFTWLSTFFLLSLLIAPQSLLLFLSSHLPLPSEYRYEKWVPHVVLLKFFLIGLSLFTITPHSLILNHFLNLHSYGNQSFQQYQISQIFPSPFISFLWLQAPFQ